MAVLSFHFVLLSQLNFPLCWIFKKKNYFEDENRVEDVWSSSPWCGQDLLQKNQVPAGRLQWGSGQNKNCIQAR